MKLQKNNINYTYESNFGKYMPMDTKLCLRNVELRATLNYESEIWILNRKETQKSEAALMFSDTAIRQRNSDIRIITESYKYSSKCTRTPKESGEIFSGKWKGNVFHSCH
jgi:hypothetical protein